jgi:alpha-1,3-mannosyltransferase
LFLLSILTFFTSYDVIHIHGTDQLLDGIALSAFYHKKPFCLTTHGLYFHTETFHTIKKLYLRTITRWALQRAFAIFAVSQSDADTLKTVGLDPVVMRNPIVPIQGVFSEGKDLLYLGRLSQNKRVGKLIDWLSQIHNRGYKGQLHIVGNDPEGLQKDYEAQARALKVSDQVHFHGFIDADRLAELCRRSAYCVSASRYEGYGLAMVEAMSAGVLPVMHDNAAFRETHTLSGCGLVTDFDDINKAADDFMAYQAQVSLQDRQKAQHYALSQSWDSVVERLNDYYASALNMTTDTEQDHQRHAG